MTQCWHCNENHRVVEFEPFIKLLPEKRLEFVRKHRACFFCLRLHRQPCLAKREKCVEPGCKYFHHKLLHGAPFEDINKRSTEPGNSETATGTITAAVQTPNSQKLLPIITGTVSRTKDDFKHKVANILLDSGSEVSLIRNDVAQLSHFCVLSEWQKV